MTFVATAVVPIFGLIALGFAAARWQWLSATAGKGISEFTFLIALPALLFRTMVTSDLGQTQPTMLLGSYFTTVGVIWGVATLAALWLQRPKLEQPAFAMTASYGNLVLLGIPIVVSVFGHDAAPIAAVIVSVHVAALWLAACLHLALVSLSGRQGPLQILRAVVIEFARNPIVVAIVVGGLWRLTGLGLHDTLERGIWMLAQASVPCALVAVGFSLSGFRIVGEMRALGTSAVLKNICMPMVAAVVTTQLFGMTGLGAIIVTVFSAMPTGTATFLFASRTGAGIETTSASVALSTAISMISIPIVLLLIGGP
ncbi:MAG: AEC family transporter [Hyphomicrobiaceae bacterium]